MTELLTAAQMRAIEQAAIESGDVTGLELMERAGQGVVEAIFEEWPELAGDATGDGGWRGQPLQTSPGYLGTNDEQAARRAVVLCGPGNNGGDGFVIARLLDERGWAVEVFLYGDPETLPPDARMNFERWGELGEVKTAEVECLDNTENAEASRHVVHSVPDVIVDALFGTGLKRQIRHRDIRDWFDESHDWLNSRHIHYKVVSVDVPSGVCADSGRTFLNADRVDASMRAALTVTFHSPKVGHYLDVGPNESGKVVVKQIGLTEAPRGAATPLRPRPAPQGGGEIAPTLGPGASLGDSEQFVRLVDEVDVSSLTKQSSHKYTHGHALILSGGPGKGGAARLTARGALRIGAGLVTVGCPPAALPENAGRLDAIMLRPVGDAEAFGSVLEDDRINALCLGPGLGLGDIEASFVEAALGWRGEPRPTDAKVGWGSPRRSVVLDADALTLLSRDGTLFDALHDRCVLTPHAGEFARLFPDIAEKLAEVPTKGPACSKVDATREAAARAGCVVLFKGPDTVIAHPDGRASINSAHYDRAVPWLATAGSGDVLAGFITGLLARGFDPMQAAETAAWLHVECALAFGPGLIAEDLPEMLPRVFAKLGVN